MINIKTGKATNTKDVHFLGKMFGEVYDPVNFQEYKTNGSIQLDTPIVELEEENNQNPDLDTTIK